MHFCLQKDSSPNAEQLAHLKHLCSPDAEIIAQMGFSNIFKAEAHDESAWISSPVK
jgi:hypothetical protein